MQFWKDWTWDQDFNKKTWLSFIGVTLSILLIVSYIVYIKCWDGISSLGDKGFREDLGFVALIYVAMTLTMLWLWGDMCNYFAYVRQRAGAEVGTVSRRLARVTPEILRRQIATHDPPGDTFTLVGIGFTFIGLIWATFSIDPDTIKALINGDKDADQFIRAAVMFGLSLCVGLIGSLYGVTLALLSRGLAAKLIDGIESAPVRLSRKDAQGLDRDLVELDDRSEELVGLANASVRQIDNARAALVTASKSDATPADVQSAIKDAKRDLTSAKATISDLNERAGRLREGVNRARDELQAL